MCQLVRVLSSIPSVVFPESSSQRTRQGHLGAELCQRIVNPKRDRLPLLPQHTRSGGRENGFAHTSTRTRRISSRPHRKHPLRKSRHEEAHTRGPQGCNCSTSSGPSDRCGAAARGFCARTAGVWLSAMDVGDGGVGGGGAAPRYDLPNPQGPGRAGCPIPRLFCVLGCVTGIHAPWVVHAAPDAAKALLPLNSVVLGTAAPVVRVARVDAPALILCASSSETW